MDIDELEAQYNAQLAAIQQLPPLTQILLFVVIFVFAVAVILTRQPELFERLWRWFNK